MAALGGVPFVVVLICLGLLISSPWVEAVHKCLETPNKGTCGGSQTLFYFDQHMDRCTSAEFTTCPKGQNFFRNRMICERTCALFIPRTTKPPTTTPAPTTVHKCLQRKLRGPCGGSQFYYYFDKNSGSCVYSQFSSCPGGQNFFRRRVACENTCSAYMATTTKPPPTTTLAVPITGSDRCLEAFSVGECSGTTVYRSYFSLAEKKCKMALFSSCHGTINFFNDIVECETTCRVHMASTTTTTTTAATTTGNTMTTATTTPPQPTTTTNLTPPAPTTTKTTTTTEPPTTNTITTTPPPPPTTATKDENDGNHHHHHHFHKFDVFIDYLHK